MNDSINTLAISLAEKGAVPDFLLSFGIERACGQRLREVRAQYSDDPASEFDRFLTQLDMAPIAESTDEANEQHYELPPEFFQLILGPRRKYSGCEWPKGVTTLADAEVAALKTVVARADIRPGQRILELGCGWGSLCLYLAEKFPSCEIVTVSNSAGQRGFIESVCVERGFSNLKVITADINEFEPDGTFDRVVTIEMLEHVRNYSELFARIKAWLAVDGKLFVHVFRHKDFAYLFETEGSQNWMGRHFFTGGVMPSHDLLIRAQDSLDIIESWQVNGTNYALTADAWLDNMTRNRTAIMRVLDAHYGATESSIWYQRWRMFFMACRELFGFDEGMEWGVSHYLFRRA
ncbi:MAG: SAM-dependent methyltransferase [Fimbriimonadaceae bacterium]